MVLDGIHDRDEGLYDLLCLGAVLVVVVGPTDEEGAREVSHTIDDGLQPGAAAPVAVVRGAIAEDEHEADDDGEGGHDGGGDAEVVGAVGVEGDDKEREERVDGDGDDDGVVDGAFDEAEGERPSVDLLVCGPGVWGLFGEGLEKRGFTSVASGGTSC